MDYVVPQAIETGCTSSAIFIVLTINNKSDSAKKVKALDGNLAALVRTVGSRDLDGKLSCVMAFGSDGWDKLFQGPKPKDLHILKEIRGVHFAPSTPGDIHFHIRAARMDLCFEIATLIMSELGDSVTTVEEVHGFRYFDDRSMVGFVDGVENPEKHALQEADLLPLVDPNTKRQI